MSVPCVHRGTNPACAIVLNDDEVAQGAGSTTIVDSEADLFDALLQLESHVHTLSRGHATRYATLPSLPDMVPIPKLGIHDAHVPLAESVAIDRIKEVSSRMYRYYESGGTAVDDIPPHLHQEFLEDILSVGGPRHARSFVAGMANGAPAWNAWVSIYEKHIPEAKKVLSMINDGISAEFCHPDASCQKRHPHFQSNARGVRKMLSSVLHPEHIHAVLSRSIPTPLKMPHHPSAAEHHDDIDASVQGMLASGVLLNVHDLGFSAEQCRYYVDHCLLTTGLGYVYRQSNGKTHLGLSVPE